MSRHSRPYRLLFDDDHGRDGEGRHRAPESFLVYVEDRSDGYASGQVIAGSGDDALVIDFEVDDSEPEDVWGPIMSRIAEEALGLNGSPDHCDGEEVNGLNVGVAALLIHHDGTPS